MKPRHISRMALLCPWWEGVSFGRGCWPIVEAWFNLLTTFRLAEEDHLTLQCRDLYFWWTNVVDVSCFVLLSLYDRINPDLLPSKFVQYLLLVFQQGFPRIGILWRKKKRENQNNGRDKGRIYKMRSLFFSFFFLDILLGRFYWQNICPFSLHKISLLEFPTLFRNYDFPYESCCPFLESKIKNSFIRVAHLFFRNYDFPFESIEISGCLSSLEITTSLIRATPLFVM